MSKCIIDEMIALTERYAKVGANQTAGRQVELNEALQGLKITKLKADGEVTIVDGTNVMHPNNTLSNEVQFLQNVWNSRYPKTNKTVGYKSMVEAFNFQKSKKVNGKKVTRPVLEQKQLMAELVTKVVANDPKFKEELMKAKGYIVIGDAADPDGSKLGKDTTKMLEDTLMRHKMLLDDGEVEVKTVAETKQKDGNITDTDKKNNRHEELKECMNGM